MKHRRRLAALGVLLTALLVAPVVGAQQQTGRIDGVVTDASGAVVPGATIVLSGATAQLETTTGPNGDYHFLNLSPGTYTVTAKLPGFAEVSRENVIVQTGGSTQIDLQMRPAGVTEAVPSPARVRSSIPGGRRNEVTFDQTQLQEIPTARDPWVLLQQVPGVLVDRVNVGGNESGQQSHLHSRRERRQRHDVESRRDHDYRSVPPSDRRRPTTISMPSRRCSSPPAATTSGSRPAVSGSTS